MKVLNIDTTKTPKGVLLTNNTVLFSDYWGTATDGILQGVCKGFPPHQLGENQFPLTPKEYHFLALTQKYTINEMKNILRSVSRKIKETK